MVALADIAEKLGRLDERTLSFSANVAEIRAGQTLLAGRIDLLAGEVRDARTAWRTGAWMATKLASVGGVIGAALVTLATSLGWTIHK